MAFQKTAYRNENQWVVLCLFLLLSSPSLAQLEFANWIWHDTNFVSWVSGQPIDSVGPGNNQTGNDGASSTISGRNGSIKVAAKGTQVYNGSGQLMIPILLP